MYPAHSVNQAAEDRALHRSVAGRDVGTRTLRYRSGSRSGSQDRPDEHQCRQSSLQRTEGSTGRQDDLQVLFVVCLWRRLRPGAPAQLNGKDLFGGSFLSFSNKNKTFACVIFRIIVFFFYKITSPIAYMQFFLYLCRRIYAEAVFCGGGVWVLYILTAFIDALYLTHKKLSTLLNQSKSETK